MHPSLLHLGPIALPVQGFLVALGLLAGTQLSCSIAARAGLTADRIWSLCLVALLTLFLGERLLIVAFNLGDFIRHPFWILGLKQVRDERYFYGATLMAFCAGFGYISACRLSLIRVADIVAPGAGLILASASLGSLAAAPVPGSPAIALWARAGQTHSALVLESLCAAALYLTYAAIASWLALKAKRAGSAAAFWLIAAGCTTILQAQLRYRMPGEWLIFNAFTPAEILSLVGLVIAFRLWWYPPPPEASSALPQAPGPGL